MLKLEQDKLLSNQFPMLDDDYIEKMANFYISEAAKVIFPNLHEIPFEKWLFSHYILKFERSDDEYLIV